MKTIHSFYLSLILLSEILNNVSELIITVAIPIYYILIIMQPYWLKAFEDIFQKPASGWEG